MIRVAAAFGAGGVIKSVSLSERPVWKWHSPSESEPAASKAAANERMMRRQTLWKSYRLRTKTGIKVFPVTASGVLWR